LPDEEKDNRHAGCECFGVILSRTRIRDDAILSPIRHKMECISRSRGSYVDIWQALHQTFPHLLSGTHGVTIDTEPLEIIRTFEARMRAQSRKVSFSPPLSSKTRHAFAHQHARWIHDAGAELGLPQPYIHDRVQSAQSAAKFSFNQKLKNVGAAIGKDLTKADTYRRKQAVENATAYCADAMKIYQQHGGIVEFFTITLPKHFHTERNLSKAEAVLKAIKNAAKGGGMSLKQGIGVRWRLEEHKSFVPHLHLIAGFPDDEARKSFHKRLRNGYRKHTLCMSAIPANAIRISKVAYADDDHEDIIAVARYTQKDLDKRFFDLIEGKRAGNFGTLWQGGQFKAENGRFISIPAPQSDSNFPDDESSNLSNSPMKNDSVRAYGLDNQERAENPVSTPPHHTPVLPVPDAADTHQQPSNNVTNCINPAKPVAVPTPPAEQMRRWIDLRDPNGAKLKAGQYKGRTIFVIEGCPKDSMTFNRAVSMLGFKPSASGRYLSYAVPMEDAHLPLSASAFHAVWPDAEITDMRLSDYRIDFEKLISASRNAAQKAAPITKRFCFSRPAAAINPVPSSPDKPARNAARPRFDFSKGVQKSNRRF